jgi:hypothetical protein
MSDITKIYTAAGKLDSTGNFHLGKSALIYNLLLFEESIVQSANLREFDELVKVIGIEKVIQILQSGAIKVDHYPCSIGSVNLSQLSNKEWCHIDARTIHGVDMHNWRAKELDKLRIKYCIPKHQFGAFERGINDSLVVPNEKRYFDSLEFSTIQFSGNPEYVCRRVIEKLEKNHGCSISRNDAKLKISRLRDRILVESNLCEISKLSPEKIFQEVQDSFLEISSPFSSAELAREFDAIVTLSEKESRNLDLRISSLLKGQDEENFHENLIRVLDIAKMPSFESNFSEINIDKLIQLRSCDEIVAFRNWIKTSSRLSDKEIKDLFSSLNSQISAAFQSPVGKMVRIGLATTLDPSVGVGWALVESFVLDRLFKANPIVTFINDELPLMLPIHSS